MKKILLMVSMSAMALAAWAQNAPLQGISESTDPAKVQDVEKRADEIRSRQTQASGGASSSSAGEAGKGHHAKRKHGKAGKHRDAGSGGSASQGESSK